MIMMHAGPIRPHKLKQLPNNFELMGLAPVAWHNSRLSLYISSRISNRFLTYVIVVSVPAED